MTSWRCRVCGRTREASVETISGWRCECGALEWTVDGPIKTSQPTIPREAIEKEVEWLRSRARIESAIPAVGAYEDAADRLSALLSDTKDRCGGSGQIWKHRPDTQTSGNPAEATGGATVYPCPGCPDCDTKEGSDDLPRWLSVEASNYRGGGVMGRRRQKDTKEGSDG